MNFILIGESVGRIPSATLEEIDSIPWHKIKGFRNLVAHNSLA